MRGRKPEMRKRFATINLRMEVERLYDVVFGAPVVEIFSLMVQTVVDAQRSVYWLLFLVNRDGTQEYMEVCKQLQRAHAQRAQFGEGFF
ncbi:hypothetical protein Hdeb2414_s0002g00060301 [Helianthus debilis subsp. tardiflorus]